MGAAGTRARKPAPDQTTDTYVEDDLSIFFDGVFAQAIQYLPSVGAATEIQAIINREAPYQEPYVRGEGIANCEIEVQVSDVATPNYGDRFQIASEMWEYDAERGVIEQDEYTITIGLERQI